MRKNLSLLDFFVDESWHIRLNTKIPYFSGGYRIFDNGKFILQKKFTRFLTMCRKIAKMKKRILSVLISGVLLFGTVFANAVSVDFIEENCFVIETVETNDNSKATNTLNIKANEIIVTENIPHIHTGNSVNGGGCYGTYVAASFGYSIGAYIYSWIGSGHYAYACNRCKSIISNAHMPGTNNGMGELDPNALSNAVHRPCSNPQYPGTAAHYELNCNISSIGIIEIVKNIDNRYELSCNIKILKMDVRLFLAYGIMETLILAM